MRNIVHPFFLLYLLIVLCSSKAGGQSILQQSTQEQLTQTETDSIVQQSFPSTGITEAFTATNTLINESEKQLIPKETLDNYTSDLDSLFSIINDFLGDSSITDLKNISVRELNEISSQAKSYQDLLDLKIVQYTEVAKQLENESARLYQTRTRWQLTLDGRADDEALEPMAERIERTIARLDSVRSLLQEDLSVMRGGLEQLSAKTLLLEEVVERTRGSKSVVGGNLLKIDSRGFFKELSEFGETNLISSHKETFVSTLRNDFTILKSEFSRPLFSAALFLVALLVFTIWFKKNYSSLIACEDFPLTSAQLAIVNSPIVSSLFVVGLLVRFLIPDLPVTFFSLNVFILMVPVAILMVRILGARVRKWILVVVIAYALLILFELSYHPGPILRILLMAIAVAGIWLFAQLFKRKPFDVSFKYPLINSFFRLAIAAFILFSSAAIVANLVGAFQLAEFLANLPIRIVVLAIGVQVASRMVDSIVYLALISNKLQKVHVIKEDLEYIHRKIMWVVDLFLGLFFLTKVLEVLLLKDAVFERAGKILNEGKNFWNIDFTVANILVFFFVIWLSLMITRIISRILEMDVFTRVNTAKGIPQTIILLLRIALITGGFFLAAGAAGMQLTNLSIVLGAFSVGIGFGLQNIFNNMVSGLILAFERPIKVGDVVQVGELVGTVKSIGLRSSIVQSFDGSEVIVPNGNLISDQMINWTKSDSNRRMDIRAGVAYGTDPEVVIALMVETASEFEAVLKNPPPRAYFLEFGDSSLNFRLLAWVHLDVRLETESAIKVTINRKLKEAGIEIPFPQRDLHIRSDATNSGREGQKSPQ